MEVVKKFRVQMKIEDRVYTGIHETLHGALSLLLEKVLLLGIENDLWAVGKSLSTLHEETEDMGPPDGLFEAWEAEKKSEE
jgi:hypothetical protein